MNHTLRTTRAGDAIKKSGLRAVGITLLMVGALAGCAQPRQTGTHSGTNTNPKASIALDDIGPLPPLPPTTPHDPVTPDPAAMRLLATAQARFAEELWTEAIEAAERAARLSPNWIDAHLLAGRAALQQGNAAAASLHAEEALRLSPRDARVHMLRGAIARSQENADAAIANFRLALRCEAPDAAVTPQRVLTHLYLGLTLVKQGYLRAARGQLETYQAFITRPADELTADPELKAAISLHADKVAICLAEIYEYDGEHTLAADALARAVEANPGDIAIQQRWARSLALAGREEAALRVARKAAEASDDESAVKLLDEVCRLLGKPAQSDAELQRLTSRPGRTGLAMRVAERLSSAGRSSEAESLLQQAAEANPNAVELLYRLADLQRRTGRWTPFTTTLLRALRVGEGEYSRFVEAVMSVGRDAAARMAIIAALGSDESPSATLMRAVLMMAEGRADDASNALAAGFERIRRDGGKTDTPGSGPLCAVLAEQWLKAHRWNDAAEACRAAIARDLSSAAVQLTLGDALEADDQVAAAEAAYREAARIPPRSAKPLLRLAALQERRRDMLRAEQTYRQIIVDVDVRSLAAYEALLRNLVATGQMDKAAAVMRDVKRLKLSGPEITRASAFFELVRQDGAASTRLQRYREVVEKLLAEHPNDITSRMDLAYGWMYDGKYAQALPELNRVLTVEPGHVAAREVKVEVLGRLLKQDEAHRLLRDMLAERPRSSRWRELMLQLALDRVDDETALFQLDELLKRDDLTARRPVYQGQRLAVLLAAERFEEAILAARALYKSDEKNDTHRAQYASALERAGRHDEAIRLAEELLEIDPARADARAFYIERLLAGKRHAEATRTLLAWMEEEPDNDGLALMLGDALFAARDYSQTIALLTHLGTDGSNPRAFRVLIEAYERSNQWDDALSLLESYARRQPDVSVDSSLIDIYMQSGRLNDAERLLNKQLEPLLQQHRAGRTIDVRQASGLMRSLSVIYTRLKQEGRADALLQQAYALAPNDPGINNDLGYGWADAGKNLDKAEEMIRFAVSAEPRQDAYLDSLGWVYYKKGDFAGAAEWLRRALRWVDPVDPVIHDHAGDVQFRLGHADAARGHWRKAHDALREPNRRSVDSQRDAELLKNLEQKLADLEAGKPPTVAPAASQPVQ